MKVLITGGRGQLGRDLAAVFGAAHDCVAIGRSEADITEHEAVMAVFRSEAPDLVLHAAAHTDVDGCEREAEIAYRVNALGAWNVAAAARACGARLVAV